ncbi:MAG: DUF1385 domain-containing protein [Lachnospiraceae bacterium]|nr:DUF1385 domain-containing protein [Lachnospiraceae bacterium]
MTYSGIGGQAVMEGVMMRNKEKYAVAVRRQDGEIELMEGVYKGIVSSETVYKIPFVRGIFSFIDSLVLGLKTLNFSSDIYMEESGKEEEKSEAPKGPKKKSAKDTAVTTVIMIVAVLVAMGLFMILPYFASQLFKNLTDNQHILALLEGVIRLAVFVLYIKAISSMEDIRRVFMYHGAEHKCINCIEGGKPLTVDNVRSSSKEHRRCGTSFLLYVMVISILFFALIESPNHALRVVLRIVLIPVIAGVSYELIRLAGRSDNVFIRALSAPGLWMQRLTTSEPDDTMIEVGIRSVEAVFDWKSYLKENFGEKT